MNDTQALAKRLLVYKQDPVIWFREVCGIDLTEQQQLAARAVAKPGARVSIRSGHGTGKSFLSAGMMLWFLSMFPDDTQIPATAPSAHQLTDSLWGGVSLIHAKMIPLFKDRLIVTRDKIMVKGQEKHCFAAARTSPPDNPDSLQGFHAKNLLIVIDEASGIRDKVLEVAEGTLSTPGSRMLVLGNPTKTRGFFYRSHTSEKKNWESFVFNAEESSNVSPDWCREMERKYGRDSDVYRVRVLGEFPKGGADSLIPIDLVEEAIGREIEPIGTRIAGLDIADSGGDSTVLLIREGEVITSIEEWRGKNPMETAGIVVEAYRKRNLFDRVHVDAIGMGTGVVGRLKELGIPVMGVNVGESSSTVGRFNRLRDELWWNVREWFESKKCAIKEDIDKSIMNTLIAELTGISYQYLSNGKLKVQGKRAFKEDGVVISDGLKRSPNIGDALCLTMAEGRVDNMKRRTALNRFMTGGNLTFAHKEYVW